VTKLWGWATKLGGWVIQLGGWVIKLGGCVAKARGWVAKLVARPLTTAALVYKSRHPEKNLKWAM